MKVLDHVCGQAPLLRDMTQSEVAETQAGWAAAAAAAAAPKLPSLAEKVALLQARFDAMETQVDRIAVALPEPSILAPSS